jgi:asparagine synthase (glutamine-hydrolysing)
MSGIIAIINLPQNPVDKSLLEKMTNYMSFRGVDSQNIYCADNIGLGHTLLKIYPEQATEKQPFTTDNNIWIVADARLDRREELVSKLQNLHAEINTNCPDVELILSSYYTWGEKCIEHLRGDFLFIIWNHAQQKLFVARDHFGIIPCFYAQFGETLIITNTFNTIRLHPQFSPELNPAVVGEFLINGKNLEWETTIFKQIKNLPNAHTLTWENGTIKTQQYWQIPGHLRLTFYPNPQDYVEHFSQIFTQAVADRIRTDKIATHLSGGMDSTSIATTAYQILADIGKPFDFQAFTTREREMMPEEDSYATMIAHFIGIPCNQVSGDLPYRCIPPEFPDTPFFEPYTIPGRNGMDDLITRCGNHSRLVLTGFGGDPALRFGELLWLEYSQQGLWKDGLLVSKDFLRRHGTRPYLSNLRRGWKLWRKLSTLSKEQLNLPEWFNPDFVKATNLQAKLDERIASQFINIARYGMNSSRFWANIFLNFDPSFTGLPVKHVYPFFDLELFNFVNSIPPIPWLVDKNILRKSMQGKLPTATLNRPKTVFRLPNDYPEVMGKMVDVWIRDLLKSNSELENYIDVDKFLEMLKPDNIDVKNATAIDMTLSFAYWLNTRYKLV